MKIKVANNFWVAGDIFFPLPDGAPQEVFRLAHDIKDASVFDRATADAVAKLVTRKMKSVYDSYGKPLNVEFDVRESLIPKGLWVVYGRQEVEFDQ